MMFKMIAPVILSLFALTCVQGKEGFEKAKEVKLAAQDRQTEENNVIRHELVGAKNGQYTYYTSDDYYDTYDNGMSQSNRHMKRNRVHIPYIDRNGCRFPGDVVCDRTSRGIPRNTNVCNYKTCLLSDENKNLWKKPSMELTPIEQKCGQGVGVLTEFCNNNDKILKVIGFIKETTVDNLDFLYQKKYVKALNPCILRRSECTG